MIEGGLVEYIQAGLAALSPPVNVPGGFADVLPKDTISSGTPQAWLYRSVMSAPSYVLAGQTGWTDWHVQIDCHGITPLQRDQLARAINVVLRGLLRPVTLPDQAQTFVFGAFCEDESKTGYSDANRTWVRSLEYVVSYQQV